MPQYLFTGTAKSSARNDPALRFYNSAGTLLCTKAAHISYLPYFTTPGSCLNKRYPPQKGKAVCPPPEGYLNEK